MRKLFLPPADLDDHFGDAHAHFRRRASGWPRRLFVSPDSRWGAAVDPLHAHRHPQTRSIAAVSRKQKRPLSRPFWMTPAEVKNQ
jgi:hypothetical protein